MSARVGEHPFGDAGQFVALAAFLIVWVGDSFFLCISTQPAEYVPLAIRLAVGALILILACVLFRSGHAAATEERRPIRVIDSGGFRWVRHPLYLASVLAYLAFAIATLSLISLAVWIGICVFYNHIAVYEERFMEKEFGEAYRAYMRKTGRWLPKFGGNRG